MSAKSRFVLIVSLFVLAGACQRAERATLPPTSTASKPAISGPARFVIVRSADSSTLDPRLATSAEDLRVTRLIYPNLVQWNPARSRFEPSLATYRVEPDGKAIVFDVDSNRRFTDGTVIDAAAVKRSLERWRTAVNGGDDGIRTLVTKAIGPITVSGPAQLRMELSGNPIRALSLLASPYCGIVGAGEGEGLASQSGGMYKLARWDHASRTIELTRNDGAPAVWPSTLVLKAADSDELKRALVERGEAQAMDRMPAEWSTKPLGALRMVSAPGQNLLCLVFNTRKAPFNRIEARREVIAAFDKRAFIKGALFGLAEPADNLLPATLAVLDTPTAPTPPSPTAQPSERFSGRVRIVGPSFTPFDLLAVAGKDTLDRLGYKSETVTGSDIAVLVRQWESGTHHVGVYRYLAEVPDPGYFLSQIVTPGGSGNLSFFTDATIEADLKAYERASTESAAIQALEKLRTDLNTAAILVPVANMRENWLVRRDVTHFKPLSSTFFTFE